MSSLIACLVLLATYLIGSLSSAIIVCKLMRLPDPRTQGSQNPGATNVLRLGGKIPALITLLGDLLKGFIPILILKQIGFSPLLLSLAALLAVLGHLYPLFFGFKGGKGVATMLGCLLALAWPAGICWILTWLMIAALSRYSSLAALIASLLAPYYLWLFTKNLPQALVFILITLLLIARHRSNIVRLYQGTESKIGKKKVS